jgi:hypothetical protein
MKYKIIKLKQQDNKITASKQNTAETKNSVA